MGAGTSDRGAPPPTRVAAVTGEAGWWPQLRGHLRAEPAVPALMLMALVGIAISIYLTSVHYLKTPLACSTTGLIDCETVLASRYSVVPGTDLPITLPGMFFFVVSLGLAGVALASRWRGQPEPTRLRLAHVLWSLFGLVFVLYLVYAEIVKLNRICAWCTGVHLLTLLTFLVALHRLQQGALMDDYGSSRAPVTRRRASMPGSMRTSYAPHASQPSARTTAARHARPRHNASAAAPLSRRALGKARPRH